MEDLRVAYGYDGKVFDTHRHRVAGHGSRRKERTAQWRPQMVEISRNGRRIYFTNSLYGGIDAQFYPDAINGWRVKLERNRVTQRRLLRNTCACHRVDFEYSWAARSNMKRPAKSVSELEAMIRVQMEEICAWPTDMAIAVHPDGDSWKAIIMQEHRKSDEGLTEIVQTICDRLRTEYDLSA